MSRSGDHWIRKMVTEKAIESSGVSAQNRAWRKIQETTRIYTPKWYTTRATCRGVETTTYVESIPRNYYLLGDDYFCGDGYLCLPSAKHLVVNLDKARRQKFKWSLRKEGNENTSLCIATHDLHRETLWEKQLLVPSYQNVLEFL